MKLCVAILAIAGVLSGAVAPKEYRRKTINKQAAGSAAASALIGTARNAPHEWKRTPLGFVKRAASSIGQHVVKGTIELGVSSWRHEDLRYQPSTLQGTWPRLKYAIQSTFIVPRTGGRAGKTFAVGRVAGNLGGGLVSRAWQPASAAGVGAGFASAGIGLAADVGFHVVREFWPRKKTK